MQTTRMPQQSSLFAEAAGDDGGTAWGGGTARRAPLPLLGEQSDIRYYARPVRGIVNGPETTGMDFWSINPYVGCAFGCAYCYARYAHRYAVERVVRDATTDGADGADAAAAADFTDLPSWLAFERRIFVKQGAGDALRRALRGGGGPPAGSTLVIGTATDPYQPAERRYRVTRGVLAVLAEHVERAPAGRRLSLVIITKSPLVTRDADLLRRIAARGCLVSVHVSLITGDRELARRLEPRAPTPEARLRAVARLRAAGVDVSVNVMPVLPGITDAPAALDDLVRRIAAAGATAAGACALRLRAAARRRYLPFIEAEFPALAPRYRGAYAASHRPGEAYRAGLDRVFARLCAKYGLRHARYDEMEEGEEQGAESREQDAGRDAGQLTLGV